MDVCSFRLRSLRALEDESLAKEELEQKCLLCQLELQALCELEKQLLRQERRADVQAVIKELRDLSVSLPKGTSLPCTHANSC